MAKKSAVQKNMNKAKLVERYAAKRARLIKTAEDQSVSGEERMKARMALAEMPRNSSRIRLRNRCVLSGRPRGYYRKFGLSRIALRELGSDGKIPGMVKASW